MTFRLLFIFLVVALFHFLHFHFRSLPLLPKVLINVWGAFSVIFLATYTANIAAHFAGLFLAPEVNDFHDTSVSYSFTKFEILFSNVSIYRKQLMKQRTGTARSSASEGYLMEKYTELYEYSQKFKVDSFEQGLEELR